MQALKRALSAFLPIVAVNLFFAILFWRLLDTHMLPEANGSLGSFGSVWGDLPWHASIIMGAIERGIGSALSDPVYAGVKLSYPFLPELLTAAFVKMGLSLRASLILTTWPFLVALTALICTTSYRFTRNVWGAALAPVLFYCTGSIVGMLYFWRDFTASQGSLWHFLLTMPRSYANDFDRGLHFTNAIADFILPQRVIIFGFVLGLVAVNFLWSWLETHERKHLLRAAVAIGFLPLMHTHSFVALCIIIGSVVSLDTALAFFSNNGRKESVERLKDALLAFVLLTLLAIPQLSLVFPATGKSFIQWQIGWLAGESFGAWILFWFRNLGAYALLIPATFIVLARRAWRSGMPEAGKRTIVSRILGAFGLAPGNAPDARRTVNLLVFFLAFTAVFAIANLLVFQPWDWDNMKLFLWWFLGCVILLPSLFSGGLWKRDPEKKGVGAWLRLAMHAVLVIALTLTGALALLRETQSVPWPLFSPADRELAAYVQRETPKDAVFLTSDKHNNPIAALAGRQLFMGYKGWLWTHGIDYAQREREVNAIYAGSPQAKGLIETERIAYVLVERDKVSELHIDTTFFEKNFTPVFGNADFTLYQVR